jgi:hypothetical protein
MVDRLLLKTFFPDSNILRPKKEGTMMSRVLFGYGVRYVPVIPLA